MTNRAFPLKAFQKWQTPFYYYDLELLDSTLQAINEETKNHENYHVHYAVKACANPDVLHRIRQAGLGVDCVSGGEIEAACQAGFDPRSIVFAGVGKADWEIRLALEKQIGCFNVESIPELEVIQTIATETDCTANVSFRINPNVGAHTHAHITTGLAENKFGIAMEDMEHFILKARRMAHIHVKGLHFHIGSQILEMDDFAALCNRINELQDRLENQGITGLTHINVGGGLGIDYEDPDRNPIPDFHAYFQTFASHLKVRPGQEVHFELGRSIVAQCGNLVARCLYVKEARQKSFVILDAGMTDLIRPALYGALHRIQNLTSPLPERTYDVVGPICESSDVFAHDYRLPETRRHDLLVLRSAGAYGEIMASRYNLRRLPGAYTSDMVKQEP